MLFLIGVQELPEKALRYTQQPLQVQRGQHSILTTGLGGDPFDLGQLESTQIVPRIRGC